MHRFTSVPADWLTPVVGSTRTMAAVENFVASRPPTTVSFCPSVTTTSRETGAANFHGATPTTGIPTLGAVVNGDVAAVVVAAG